MIDYEMLRVIWWLLIGVLLIGFAIADGFDFGVATLMPFIARNDLERRTLIATLLPYWEGNQVWIILGAGAIFAAWPYVYAVAFSGAYFPVLLLLLTMGILRPVSFKYRNKLVHSKWRYGWDSIIFLGGIIPSFIFGVLMGNILSGLPFSFQPNLQIIYRGDFLDLFHPFALWCGFTSICMLAMHGAFFLAIKTEASLRYRAMSAARIASVLFMVGFIVGGIWIAAFLPGFQLKEAVNHFGFSNPLYKEALLSSGAWLNNYKHYPLTIMVPVLGIALALSALAFNFLHYLKAAFICSALCISCVIGTVGVSMFPFILPSSLHPSSSLLVWDASSSHLTLLLMLFAIIVFMPIILLYTAWVYRIMRGTITEAMIEKESKIKHSAY